ncbi:MAG: ornithine cyclodeaminase [Marinosulfonomonas sp.]|nr:ornithine cyclodeaminase [Marinosulfonomonas sp.]
MNFEIIGFDEGDALLDWNALCEALIQSHTLPKAEIADTLLYRGNDTLLSRAAWIDGMGLAVKAATIFPDNPAKNVPVVNGAVNLFSDDTGQLEALIDFHLVTKWKTAGDSLLAAKQLARPDSRNILVIGAGTVAHTLRDAYGAAFPDAAFTIWNRTPDAAVQMATQYPDTKPATDLEAAVRGADIVTSATMATAPLIMGDWLQAGQHIDLIGAYRPDMREADDVALKRARVFVDSFETTINHIGELMMPLASGAITRDDLIADYYGLASGVFKRNDDSEITLFKNGGGAHLDLMVSRYILNAWRQR